MYIKASSVIVYCIESGKVGIPPKTSLRKIKENTVYIKASPIITYSK